MARRITAYCQRWELIFIETGCHEGEPVLWFRRFDGRRLRLSEDAVRRDLAPELAAVA